MKLRVTRAVFEYWDSLRGTRPAPERADIDPGAIRSCLANIFILAVDPPSGHPFRIAGTALCDMFGAELTGRPFAELWPDVECAAISDLVQSVYQNASGVVTEVTGRNADAQPVDLEMILLPLGGGDSGSGRVLGAVAVAAAMPYWLGMRRLRSLHLGALRYVAGANEPATNRRPARLPVFADRPVARYPIARSYHG
jgi:hypothetical protein